VISSSPFPQEDVSSNLVAPKMVTCNGGKGAKDKKQKPNLKKKLAYFAFKNSINLFKF
jgi:hypothetical protein